MNIKDLTIETVSNIDIKTNTYKAEQNDFVFFNNNANANISIFTNGYDLKKYKTGTTITSVSDENMQKSVAFENMQYNINIDNMAEGETIDGKSENCIRITKENGETEIKLLNEAIYKITKGANKISIEDSKITLKQGNVSIEIEDNKITLKKGFIVIELAEQIKITNGSISLNSILNENATILQTYLPPAAASSITTMIANINLLFSA